MWSATFFPVLLFLSIQCTNCVPLEEGYTNGTVNHNQTEVGYPNGTGTTSVGSNTTRSEADFRKRARLFLGGMSRENCFAKVLCGIGAKEPTTKTDIWNDYVYLMEELMVDDDESKKGTTTTAGGTKKKQWGKLKPVTKNDDKTKKRSSEEDSESIEGPGLDWAFLADSTLAQDDPQVLKYVQLEQQRSALAQQLPLELQIRRRKRMLNRFIRNGRTFGNRRQCRTFSSSSRCPLDDKQMTDIIANLRKMLSGRVSGPTASKTTTTITAGGDNKAQIVSTGVQPNGGAGSKVEIVLHLNQNPGLPPQFGAYPHQPYYQPPPAVAPASENGTVVSSSSPPPPPPSFYEWPKPIPTTPPPPTTTTTPTPTTTTIRTPGEDLLLDFLYGVTSYNDSEISLLPKEQPAQVMDVEHTLKLKDPTLVPQDDEDEAMSDESKSSEELKAYIKTLEKTLKGLSNSTGLNETLVSREEGKEKDTSSQEGEEEDDQEGGDDSVIADLVKEMVVMREEEGKKDSSAGDEEEEEEDSEEEESGEDVFEGSGDTNGTKPLKAKTSTSSTTLRPTTSSKKPQTGSKAPYKLKPKVKPVQVPAVPTKVKPTVQTVKKAKPTTPKPSLVALSEVLLPNQPRPSLKKKNDKNQPKLEPIPLPPNRPLTQDFQATGSLVANNKVVEIDEFSSSNKPPSKTPNSNKRKRLQYQNRRKVPSKGKQSSEEEEEVEEHSREDNNKLRGDLHPVLISVPFRGQGGHRHSFEEEDEEEVRMGDDLPPFTKTHVLGSVMDFMGLRPTSDGKNTNVTYNPSFSSRLGLRDKKQKQRTVVVVVVNNGTNLLMRKGDEGDLEVHGDKVRILKKFKKKKFKKKKKKLKKKKKKKKKVKKKKKKKKKKKRKKKKKFKKKRKKGPNGYSAQYHQQVVPPKESPGIWDKVKGFVNALSFKQNADGDTPYIHIGLSEELPTENDKKEEEGHSGSGGGGGGVNFEFEYGDEEEGNDDVQDEEDEEYYDDDDDEEGSSEEEYEEDVDPGPPTVWKVVSAVTPAPTTTTTTTETSISLQDLALFGIKPTSTLASNKKKMKYAVVKKPKTPPTTRLPLLQMPRLPDLFPPFFPKSDQSRPPTTTTTTTTTTQKPTTTRPRPKPKKPKPTVVVAYKKPTLGPFVSLKNEHVVRPLKLSDYDDEVEPPSYYFQPGPGGENVRGRVPLPIDKFHSQSGDMLGLEEAQSSQTPLHHLLDHQKGRKEPFYIQAESIVAKLGLSLNYDDESEDDVDERKK